MLQYVDLGRFRLAEGLTSPTSSDVNSTATDIVGTRIITPVSGVLVDPHDDEGPVWLVGGLGQYHAVLMLRQLHGDALPPDDEAPLPSISLCELPTQIHEGSVDEIRYRLAMANEVSASHVDQVGERIAQDVKRNLRAIEERNSTTCPVPKPQKPLHRPWKTRRRVRPRREIEKRLRAIEAEQEKLHQSQQQNQPQSQKLEGWREAMLWAMKLR